MQITYEVMMKNYSTYVFDMFIDYSGITSVTFLRVQIICHLSDCSSRRPLSSEIFLPQTVLQLHTFEAQE